jgi:hypothetical protein
LTATTLTGTTTENLPDAWDRCYDFKKYIFGKKFGRFTYKKRPNCILRLELEAFLFMSVFA